MKEFIQTSIGKWLVGISGTIFLATVAWASNVDRRVSVIETHQQAMAESLVSISSDVHEIRNLFITYIGKAK